MDLLELLGRVAGWVFWLAGVAAVGSAGLSMFYLALGDRDRAVTLFKGSMAAILVAAFGQNILLSVIASLGGWSSWSAQAGQVAGYPGAGTAIYIMAFIMLLLAAINLARGHVAEGGWMIVGSVLALAVVVFATQAFSTTVMQYGGGPLLVEARTEKTYYQPNEQVFLYVTVRSSGFAVSVVDLTVDWGDGERAPVQGVPVGREVKICYDTSSRKWIYVNPSEKPFYCQGKTYAVSGEGGQYFTIRIEAIANVGGSRLTGSTFITVYVRELPSLSFPFSFLGGILAWLASMLSGGALDPTRLFYAPVFRMDGPEGEWYKTSLKIAVGLLPVFMLFRIAPGLAYSPGAAIVDGFRDAAIAVMAMMLIPYAYNVTAGALNTFTEALMGPVGATVVSQMAGTAIAWGILFMIISFFSPGVGFLGFTMFATVFLISALITLRWFILLASVTASPLLVLAWMHPTLRGAAESVKGLVGAMLVAGPLAAVFTMLFTKVMLGDNPLQQLAGSFALSWLGIFIVGMLPTIVSGLAVTGLERTVAGKLEARAFQGAPQVGRAIATAGARGLAVGASVAGRGAYAAAVRVRPLADTMRSAGVMVGKARERASHALANTQKWLEERVKRAAENREKASARLQALREFRDKVEDYANTEEGAREPTRMTLELELKEAEKRGMITREERERIEKELKEDPRKAVQTLNRMVKDAEHQEQVRRADLGFIRDSFGRMAKGVEKAREVPTIVKQQIRGYLSWLGLAGRQKEEEKKEEMPKTKASEATYPMYM